MHWIKTAIGSLLSAHMLLPMAYGFADTGHASQKHSIIRLATTTSTDSSGLLGYLLPAFEDSTGYRVHVIAVGTGKALRMGRDGDADVLLVHAPEAESAFVRSGYGVNRRYVMYNDFVLVGPDKNSQGIIIRHSISTALRQIADNKLTFISRGDNSGTHNKEIELWQALNIDPHGAWYREVGQGMGKVLQMASELDAYTIADRGTWLAYQDRTTLALLSQPDPQLYNPYHIIAVNPNKYPEINFKGASALIAWITSAQAQSLIAAFTINNAQLFEPSIGAAELARQEPVP